MNGWGGTHMKDNPEDIPMAFVWYAVAGIAVIGIIGVAIIVIVANRLHSSF
jgi:hypothetical protein